MLSLTLLFNGLSYVYNLFFLFFSSWTLYLVTIPLYSVLPYLNITRVLVHVWLLT